MGAVIVGAKKASNEPFFILPSASERVESKHINVLFVCDEWNSSKGGLATFNRKFAINLAKASSEDLAIHCYVCQSNESDREDARKNGVNIITAKSIPGTSDRLEWLRLPPSELSHPDVVIGHGRKFGTPAYFITQITKCKWIQFVHVFCEDLGKYKQTKTDAVEENEKKHKEEIKLCKESNAVVAVGSRLQQKYSRCLPDTKVQIITPGILDKFVSLSDQKLANVSHGPDELSVFVFGRGSYEDLSLKGFDIIANALGSLGEKFKMTFVGSPEGQHRIIMDWFLQNTSITRRQLTVRGYCNQDEVKEMFYAADLVAMPSRTEGFGLIALEAISAAVPVLLTSESGIAKALEQIDGGKSVIIESEDPKEWSEKIRILYEKKPKERLNTAIKLRESYNNTFPWDTQCEQFKDIILRMMNDSCCAESVKVALMPKVRRKHRPERAKARLTSFLETKCFVCLDSPNEHPSRPLLYCRKYIHEECLLECLLFANQAVGDSCPHCRAPIQPYHVSSPNVPLGPNPFCFRRVHYPPPPPPPPDPDEWFAYFGIPLEPDDDPFPRYVLPPAPPGWAEYMSQF